MKSGEGSMGKGKKQCAEDDSNMRIHVLRRATTTGASAWRRREVGAESMGSSDELMENRMENTNLGRRRNGKRRAVNREKGDTVDAAGSRIWNEQWHWWFTGKVY